MRFGLYAEMQTPLGRSHVETYRDLMRQMEHADQVGFDVYSVIEHHFFQEFSISANPLALIAAAAQRTQRLRFRVALHTLPLANPMRLAGEIAAADILTGGRLETAVDILTLGEALDCKPMYASTTMVAMRAPNLRLFQEAAARARGKGETAVYLLFVDEVPGLFFPPKTGPSREARQVLATSAEFFKRAGLVAVPLWRMAHDAGASVAGAARRLGVDAVMVGTSQRNAVWHLLRGSVLKSLVKDLPPTTRVWICN